MKENVKFTFKILFSILILSFILSFLISISFNEPYSLKFVPHPKGTGTTFEGTLIVPFVITLLIFVYFIISLVIKTTVNMSPYDYRKLSKSSRYMSFFDFVYGNEAKKDFKKDPHLFFEKMFASGYISFSIIFMFLFYLPIIFSHLSKISQNNLRIVMILIFILLFLGIIILSRFFYKLLRNK